MEIVFTRFLQLREKLEEYRKRLSAYRAPELQMDTICKVAVLETLLREGRVDSRALALELSFRYGSGFDEAAFNNAFLVIDDYVKTGGQNVTHRYR